MKWLVADSLSCPEQFFASHLDSYSHFLREAGEDALAAEVGVAGDFRFDPDWEHAPDELPDVGDIDIVFMLDRYHWQSAFPRHVKRVAQVAAVCSPMPWEVRKPDGSPAFDLVLSSIPSMVEQARAAGCRAEYMPLAFDLRARACGMGVKRDLGCIFIGSVGSNHRRRTELLRELSDVVTVMPAVYGREMFRTLARARVVFNPHAEWAGGIKNNMRSFEASGMMATVVTDAAPAPEFVPGRVFTDAASAREMIRLSLADDYGSLDSYETLARGTYESRIPRLLEIARSL